MQNKQSKFKNLEIFISTNLQEAIDLTQTIQMLIVIIQIINHIQPQIIHIQRLKVQQKVQLEKRQNHLQQLGDQKHQLLHIDQHQLGHLIQLNLHQVDHILIQHDHQAHQIQLEVKEEILEFSHLQQLDHNIHKIQALSIQEIISHYFSFHFHSQLLLHAHVIICIPIMAIFHHSFLMEM